MAFQRWRKLAEQRNSLNKAIKTLILFASRKSTEAISRRQTLAISLLTFYTAFKSHKGIINRCGVDYLLTHNNSSLLSTIRTSLPPAYNKKMVKFLPNPIDGTAFSLAKTTVSALIGSRNPWLDFKGLCRIWSIVGVQTMYLPTFSSTPESITVHTGMSKSPFRCLTLCGWGLCLAKNGFLLFLLGKLLVVLSDDSDLRGHAYRLVSGILSSKFSWIVPRTRSCWPPLGVNVGILSIPW